MFQKFLNQHIISINLCYFISKQMFWLCYCPTLIMGWILLLDPCASTVQVCIIGNILFVSVSKYLYICFVSINHLFYLYLYYRNNIRCTVVVSTSILFLIKCYYLCFNSFRSWYPKGDINSCQCNHSEIVLSISIRCKFTSSRCK